MRQATLCLLLKEDQKEILLAMKKKGFGQGKWNGVGGKFDQEQDRDIFDTAIRETKEEIGVDITNNDLKRVAILHFRFPYKEEWNQDVHVFLTRNWQGEPVESDEMAPKWFRNDQIPFKEMWDDDIHWLPKVLKGHKLRANFVFKPGETIDNHNINFVQEI
tara:strand:+ start:1606 stop:2088 length:483 start_codon:yes stop_codon:yes gene_type:complete